MYQRYFLSITLFFIVTTSISTAALFSRKISPNDAQEIAVQAYIYGYSLITSEVTRVQMTNSSDPTATESIPMGKFNNLRSYPTADFRGVVAPNADTLYSIAWIDLNKQPWFFSHPNMDGRYYLFPIYDHWTSVLYDPGSRTTGTNASTYALVGPRWKRRLPKKVLKYVTKVIYSNARFIFTIGRTYCTGTKEDYDIVHQLQDQYLLRPLKMFIEDQNITYTATETRSDERYPDPPFNQTGPVRDVINNMDVSTYFNMMAARMKDNQRSVKDLRIVREMRKIGLIAGQTFNLSQFTPDVQAAISEAPSIAFKRIVAHKSRLGSMVNGWIIPRGIGKYGTDYLMRAATSLYGWGGNVPEDAIYPSASVDSKNSSLVGTNQYILHFPSKQTPPVNGFWSLTMYTSDLFFVPNLLNKYTVSPRDALVYNEDGSLDIYMQNTSPGSDKEANWLPAPTGNFTIMLRMYWPKVTVAEIVNGTWVIPAIEKVN